MNKILISMVVTMALLACSGKQLKETNSGEKTKVIRAIVNAETTYQTIDGFGVNMNPAFWNNGNLKPAIDLLVDENLIFI